MGTLVFQANLGGAVNLIGPNTASTVNFTLPSADGTSGQALVTNGSGTLSFSTFTSGAAGSNTQVQFNSSGAFAGSSNLTFNGTTLTAANTSVTTSETLSYGTANGVAYLNGSKVVTTGSALTYNGTGLGVGVASSLGILQVRTQTNANMLWQNSTFGSGGVLLNVINDAGSANATLDFQATSFQFAISGSEQMRLTSTGLGIGTSSPSYKLHVNGIIYSGTGYYVLSQASGGGNIFEASGNTGISIGQTANLLQFYTSGVEKMRLDSSGNLGLGVTPNAGTSGRVFQITNAGHFMASGSTVYIDANAYFDSGWKYITSAAASNYYQNSGAHIWQTAASGTAGNAITFTQAMTLDASGNLLVGATSTQLGERVNVTGAGILIQSSAATNRGLLGNFGGSDFVVGTYDSFALTFRTGNTERARITSGGYFKASNSGSYDGPTETCHELYQTANNNTVKISSTNASLTTDGVALFLVNRNTTNNTFYALSYYNIGAGAYKFRVADSGNVTNTNGSYGTISDVKMKTDIMDAGSQWADIKAIKFRKFKMKDDPEQVVQLGVVAQEIEQTSPGLVEEHTDRDADGNDLGTTTKSVKTSVLLMKAAVALQEAMARIEQLEADVAALKGN